jgi:hypothetical protein
MPKTSSLSTLMSLRFHRWVPFEANAWSLSVPSHSSSQWTQINSKPRAQFGQSSVFLVHNGNRYDHRGQRIAIKIVSTKNKCHPQINLEDESLHTRTRRGWGEDWQPRVGVNPQQSLVFREQ